MVVSLFWDMRSINCARPWTVYCKASHPQQHPHTQTYPPPPPSRRYVAFSPRASHALYAVVHHCRRQKDVAGNAKASAIALVSGADSPREPLSHLFDSCLTSRLFCPLILWKCGHFAHTSPFGTTQASYALCIRPRPEGSLPCAVRRSTQ